VDNTAENVALDRQKFEKSIWKKNYKKRWGLIYTSSYLVTDFADNAAEINTRHYGQRNVELFLEGATAQLVQILKCQLAA